jgi:adenine-specific DNA-methyltransferase
VAGCSASTSTFDPPYGIKFGSNWQVSTRKRDVKDAKAEDLTRQPEQVKAFRDTWELGIHSYLSYLRDRLTAARDLLTESGSIFVQIGDANVHLVRCLLDEVFGSENFYSQITFFKTAGLAKEEMSSVTDFILWYAKDAEHVKTRRLFLPKQLEDDVSYTFIELADGTRRRMTGEESSDLRKLPDGSRIYRIQTFIAAGLTHSCVFPICIDGREIRPPSGASWKSNPDGVAKLLAARRLGRCVPLKRWVR